MDNSSQNENEHIPNEHLKINLNTKQDVLKDVFILYFILKKELTHFN